METVIVSIICVVLIILGGMTLSQGFLTSADTTSVALEEMGMRDKEITRTELTPHEINVDGTGSILNIMLENMGQTKLADFNNWDLIVQYYDGSGQYHAVWLPYQAGALSDNEWTVSGIYLESNPESFEPNILNPGERIGIQAQLNPAVGANTTNMLVACTPNGIPVSIYFVR